MRVAKLLLIGLMAFFAASCDDNSELVKQNVGGKAGEIIIVADKGDWESEPGTQLREVLATPYPFLPQSEPSYTLINIPHKSFTSLFVSFIRPKGETDPGLRPRYFSMRCSDAKLSFPCLSIFSI